MWSRTISAANSLKTDPGAERAFVPLGVAVLTISDSRSSADDRSGDLLAARIESAGHRLAGRDLVIDDRASIAQRILDFVADDAIDCVITTGGTGVTGRDVTPEALGDIADKDIPGFGELFRLISFQKIGASTLQSRAAAAVVRGAYVFCLPGSPGACKDGWDDILGPQLDSRTRPCNFADLLPRLAER